MLKRPSHCAARVREARALTAYLAICAKSWSVCWRVRAASRIGMIAVPFLIILAMCKGVQPSCQSEGRKPGGEHMGGG